MKLRLEFTTLPVIEYSIYDLKIENAIIILSLNILRSETF